jgi:glycosyltransferase involved in cell wall biosynthesis
LKESAKTETILAKGAFALTFSWIILMLRRPISSCAALGAAWRLSAPGPKSKFLHLAYLLEASWLARRLAKLQVAHLHAHFGTNPAAVAMLVRALGGPPFSFTVHGPDEFDAPLALGLPAKIAAANFVVAISSYGRSQLMRWSPPREWRKIEVIGCGLDPNFLETAVQPVDPYSTEFVCIARLSAQKGLPLLVAACDRLRNEGEMFSLTIIGDGELRAQIQQQITDRSLNNVITLTGVQTAAEIREHLVRARAFVLPSFAEGLPVVLMEALSVGRPVITTSIAGIPELVDEQCGWLIPAGSEDALLAVMKEALHASGNALDAKAAVGRERVRRNHDAARNARQITEAIAARV